jgi:MFS family permease
VTGLFPGVSFFLTQWYRRYEINFRIALFFSAATAAGAFGGLLARLINEMDGVSGYEGWRWIFILEGIATVVVAFASFWMLYDYPDTAKFLTEDERTFLVARLKLDNDGCSSAFKMKFVKDAFLDWKVWVVSRRRLRACVPIPEYTLTLRLARVSVRYHVPRFPHASLLFCSLLPHLDCQPWIHRC